VNTPGAHHFAVVDTELVHHGAVMALRVDRVRMPAGRVTAREVVEHHGAVAVVAVDEQDQVLLVHQYRHAVQRRLWELPAGLLDVADEDPVMAARRELAEEVGVVAQGWSVLVDVAASPGFTDESVRVFLATGLRDVERPEGGDDEEADLVVHRVPVADAVAWVLAGEIVNSSTAAGLLAVAAVRAGGGSPWPVDAPWTDRPTRFAARGDRRG